MQILWYSRVPGFEIAYGGSNDDTFTRFKIGEDTAMDHNLEPTSISPFRMLTIGEILLK